MRWALLTRPSRSGPDSSIAPSPFIEALFISTGVVALTEIGDKMELANVLAVFACSQFAPKIPMQLVPSVAGGIFLVMGWLTLFKVERLFV